MALKQDLSLEEDVKQNYEASLKVTDMNPSKLSHQLAEKVVESFPAIYMGEYETIRGSKDREFVTCIAIQRGYALFAWAKDPAGKDEHIGFVAHISNKTMVRHWGAPEVMKAMKETFEKEGVPLSEVKVHVAGGHRIADRHKKLENLYRASVKMQRISYHVENMITEAGFTNVNMEMVNKFYGDRDYLAARKVDQRVRGHYNQFFIAASMHMGTGMIVTQTKSPRDIKPRDFDKMRNEMPMMARLFSPDPVATPLGQHWRLVLLEFDFDGFLDFIRQPYADVQKKIPGVVDGVRPRTSLQFMRYIVCSVLALYKFQVWLLAGYAYYCRGFMGAVDFMAIIFVLQAFVQYQYAE